MSTHLSLLSRAAWIEPSRAFVPAGPVLRPVVLLRSRPCRHKRSGIFSLPPLTRQRLGRRSSVSATLQTATEASVESADTQQKRTPLDDTILIQGFGWSSCHQEGWYNQIKEKVPELKVHGTRCKQQHCCNTCDKGGLTQAAGFTHIWLPPPSQSVDDRGYLPAQLYDLNSKYGSKEQLQSLTWTLNHAGIKPIADIVINHRCGDKLGPTGIWNHYRDDVQHHGRRIDWGDWAVCRDDFDFAGTGGFKEGASYKPAPDLDHGHDDVRLALADWLRWLRSDIGFMGWRFDFVKGYAARHVKGYVESSIQGEALHLAEFWVEMSFYGSALEYDQNYARQVLCDWISAAGAGVVAFDFPTKGILQEAAKHTQYDRLRDRDGKAPGLLGWWPQKACTFVDNHDTGSTQQHWPFPHFHLGLGYAYIMTHPGMPCVLWEHMIDPNLSPIITQLMSLRRRQDIHAGSKLEILCADWNLYVARIDNRVVIKLGPQGNMGILLPVAAQGWRLSVTGHDFAVWEKAFMDFPADASGKESFSNSV